LLLNSAFNFADLFGYLKTLFSKRTFGLSEFDYPQTVQSFILEAFPQSFYSFLLILAGFLCSLGFFLFVLSAKKEMKTDFSKLSRFLGMDRSKIRKQARLAALPKQALLWSLFAPVILILLLLAEAKLGASGLGNTMKIALDRGDFPLFYGSLVCAFLFVLAVNLFFLMIRICLFRG
jgi:ABC-type dipeptide/oligopeptide/nickel transport system permease component